MHIAKITLTFMVAALLGTTSTLAVAQDCSPNIVKTKPDSLYTYNAAGDWVTDIATGLTWKRCVEGMSWSGNSCIGNATSFTWESALAHAAAQPGWRLPNIKELGSLLEDACTYMAINENAFPGTPRFAWSASPSVLEADYAWIIGFVYEYGYQSSKALAYPIRLVRGQ